MLLDSLPENPVDAETLESDGNSTSQVTCRIYPQFFKTKVEFHNPQVGASCDAAAEAGPVLCSLRVTEVLPPQSMGPPNCDGALDFS